MLKSHSSFFFLSPLLSCNTWIQRALLPIRRLINPWLLVVVTCPRTYVSLFHVHVLLFPCHNLTLTTFGTTDIDDADDEYDEYDDFRNYDAYTLTEIDRVEREALAAGTYSLLSHTLIMLIW
jgi:hypothetical protein